MHSNWERFENYPEIGTLIEQYRESLRELETLKNDLRTHDNIAAIVEMSHDQAQLKRDIDGLVEIEARYLDEQRRDGLWLIATFAAVAIGLANVLLGMGIL